MARLLLALQKKVRSMEGLPRENTLIRFRISDVYLPPPREILEELHGHDILEGRVISVTRNAEGMIFVIADVKEAETPMIIPVESIISNGLDKLSD